MRFAASLVAGVIALPLAGALAAAEETAPEGASRAEVVDAQVIDRQGATRVTLRAEGPDGARLVDIYVGPAEGAAISRARAGVKTPRPMTHDLLASVVGKLGGKITRLTVSSLEGGTYIGELVITREGKGVESEEIRIDTSPSDGMALAVAARAAIYIVDEVIEQAGRPAPEEEAEEDDDEPRRPRPFGPPRDLI